MPTDPEHVRRDWRRPDAWWAHIQPLLPPRKRHPLGCHRPRVDARQALEAIFVVRRTGCPWNALHPTAICSSRAAHRRFHAWAEAGVFLASWTSGLAASDAWQGIDWAWLAMDGAMTKALLGGKQVGKHPTDRGKMGTQRSLRTDGGGGPIGLAGEGAKRHDCKMTQETITMPSTYS